VPKRASAEACRSRSTAAAGAASRKEALDALRAVTGKPDQMLAHYESPDAQLPVMNM
jgi:hypothetical protein